MPTIQITHSTPLKKVLADAKDLSESQLTPLLPGPLEVLELPTEVERSHIFVEAQIPTKNGGYIAPGYIYVEATSYKVPDNSPPGKRANISNYRTSDEGLALIKEFEGKRLHAYCCTSGVTTIGFGHTKGVSPSQSCSNEQAEKWLIEDLREFEGRVKQLVTVPLTQYQFDALVSYAFNCGGGALQRSKTLRLINSDRLNAATVEWVKGWEREAPGLLRRRKAEVALFRREVL